MDGFARDVGYAGEPFVWDDERRSVIRREIDAALLHLYKMDRVAVEHVLETFPIIRNRDLERYGDYRTKLQILKIFDEMAEAMRTGKPYQTHLDPPPGPPADEHGNFHPLPEWLPGQPRPKNWPSHIHPPRGCEE